MERKAQDRVPRRPNIQGEKEGAELLTEPREEPGAG